MKIIGKLLNGFLIVLFSAFLIGYSSEAAEDTQTVSVTIPTELSIVFSEDGTEEVGEFCVKNQSLVPVTIDSVYVTEYNNWKLVSDESTIPVNTKELAFGLEGYYLQAGENTVSISVPQNTDKKLGITVKRGAWTTTEALQSAFGMEFKYTIGKRVFQLSFDTNGGVETISPMNTYNGDKVTLPAVSKVGYDLVGWQDKNGMVYTDVYTMPIGDTTLTAKWALKKAYAVYSADDYSLTFYNTSKEIVAGSTYNGKTVTAVYTDFLNKGYDYNAQAPWAIDYALDITKVVVADTISPTTTKGWFMYLRNCNYVDVMKLDTSQVTTMQQMFSLTGNYATTFKIIGMKDWNVSKVTNMSSMFNGLGREATTFYIDDIGGWDVSNVTSMYAMFVYAGRSATWSLDLRGWDVRNVTNHNSFDSSCETQVIDPIWVN